MYLSKAESRYIKAVYELSGYEKGVRISDVAAKLNVSKASACNAIQKLYNKNMIYRDKDKLVFLTNEGEKQMILTLDKVEIIRRFLVEAIGVDTESAHKEACAIERAVSIETLCSLCRFTKRKCTKECHAKQM